MGAAGGAMGGRTPVAPATTTGVGTPGVFQTIRNNFVNGGR